VPKTDLSPIGKEFRIRTCQRVRLGPLVLEIRSNEDCFAPLRYFPQDFSGEESTQAAAHYPDYRLSLCRLDIDGPWPEADLSAARDKTYRAGRFARGYYITDHFGAAAHLLQRGRHYWIFARDFEPIVWPYLAKALLTFYSMERQLLHLKAAAVAVAGNGTLLVARGGGGKTVLMTHLCRRGAQFLSNTHSLIREESVIPIPTAMRVRNDELFGPIIAARGLRGGIKAGEYMANPVTDMGWTSGAAVSLKNICLVDYRGSGTHIVHEMGRDVLFDYMEQFALALNVYGLKEDVLDHLAGDVAQFSRHLEQMREQLRAAVDRSRCYYISCAADNARGLDAVYELLGR
jgi:hypothetical protein